MNTWSTKNTFCCFNEVSTIINSISDAMRRIYEKIPEVGRRYVNEAITFHLEIVREFLKGWGEMRKLARDYYSICRVEKTLILIEQDNLARDDHQDSSNIQDTAALALINLWIIKRAILQDFIPEVERKLNININRLCAQSRHPSFLEDVSSVEIRLPIGVVTAAIDLIPQQPLIDVLLSAQNLPRLISNIKHREEGSVRVISITSNGDGLEIENLLCASVEEMFAAPIQGKDKKKALELEELYKKKALIEAQMTEPTAELLSYLKLSGHTDDKSQRLLIETCERLEISFTHIPRCLITGLIPNKPVTLEDGEGNIFLFDYEALLSLIDPSGSLQRINVYNKQFMLAEIKPGYQAYKAKEDLKKIVKATTEVKKAADVWLAQDQIVRLQQEPINENQLSTKASVVNLVERVSRVFANRKREDLPPPMSMESTSVNRQKMAGSIK